MKRLFYLRYQNQMTFRKTNIALFMLIKHSFMVLPYTSKFLQFFVTVVIYLPVLIFLKGFTYLFFREGKGGEKRGRETSTCGCLSRGPHWGPGLQPRHVPWLGIKPMTLWFAGCHSIHWATPARTRESVF